MPSVTYAFYASLSGYELKEAHTLQQHMMEFYRRNVNDPTKIDFLELGQAFYTSNSGLTPAGDYTLDEHINAYFDTVFDYQISSAFKTEVKNKTKLTFKLDSSIFEDIFLETF